MKTAIIREAECIGCSRCVPVCPVDAIVGAHKFLHSVLLNECIGCKLCEPACPVDCIDIVELATVVPEQSINKLARAQQAKRRHKARLQRLGRAAQQQLPEFNSVEQKQATIRAAISAAVRRSKAKTTVNFKKYAYGQEDIQN